MAGSLQDLVHEIRANKADEEAFILSQKRRILQEADRENRINETKATAVLKLFYLHMLGYDVSEVALNASQVIASPKLKYKRIGYLAASEALKCNHDMLLMSTNQIIKDLTSGKIYEEMLALTCLAAVATPELAQTSLPHVKTLTTHNNNLIKRKALLTLFRLLSVYPEGFDECVDHIKRAITDVDPKVSQAAAVVVCEFCHNSPQKALIFVPPLFRMLESKVLDPLTSIKILKFMKAAAAVEPRLLSKLVEPLSHLLNSGDRAVQYEAVVTTIGTFGAAGGESSDMLMQRAASQLQPFITGSTSRTYRVLGLEALRRIHATHPMLVAPHRQIVFEAMDDGDAQVRLAAVRLLASLANDRTLASISKKIMAAAFTTSGLEELSRTESISFRKLAARLLLDVIVENNFANVSSPELLATLLADLISKASSIAGDRIADVVVRATTEIPGTRAAMVGALCPILANSRLFNDASREPLSARVAASIAWVAGEFAFADGDASVADPCSVVAALLHPSVATLQAEHQATIVSSAIKVALRATSLNVGSTAQIGAILDRALQPFVASPHPDVAQRAAEGICVLGLPGASNFYTAPTAVQSVLEHDFDADALLHEMVLDAEDFQWMTSPPAPKAQVQVAAAPEPVQQAAPAAVPAAPKNDLMEMLSGSSTPATSTPSQAAAKAADADAWLFDAAPSKSTGLSSQRVEGSHVSVGLTGFAAPATAPAATKPAGSGLDDLLGLGASASTPAPAPKVASAMPTSKPAAPAGGLDDLLGLGASQPAAAQPAQTAAAPQGSNADLASLLGL